MWRRRGSSLVCWITDPQTANRDSIGLRKAGGWGEGDVLLCRKIPHTWNAAGLSRGTLMWGPVAIYTCAWGLDSLSHTLKPQTAGITQGKALNQQPLHTRHTLTKWERGGQQHDCGMEGLEVEKTLLSPGKHSNKQTAGQQIADNYKAVWACRPRGRTVCTVVILSSKLIIISRVFLGSNKHLQRIK